MSANEIPDGLPEALPAGERMLWQGRPRPAAMIRTAFRLPWVAGYFAVLFAWRFLSHLADGDGVAGSAAYAVWILPLAAVALALLVGLGWAAAKTTRYSVTDRRVVLKIGVALPITVNLPFGVVEAAAVKRNGDGTGDIAFRIEKGAKAGYAALWPHVRPFRIGRPEPSLRAIPDVDRVAARIAEALGGSAAAPRAERSAASAGVPGGLVPAE